MTEPSLAGIHAARAAIADVIRHTPLRRSPFLSRLVGAEVRLKLENEQPSGAFKLRGAANAVASLAAGTPGVVCCSSGNHGRAVAWAAARRRIRCVVFVSTQVPAAKIRRIETLAAEVRVVGATSDEAQAACSRMAATAGFTEIHPFDDPRVIAGQGTIGLEILEDCPGVAAILLPLSGGGLAGGVALAVKSLRPEVRIIGVSMAAGAAMHAAMAAGAPVAVAEEPSLADALVGGIGPANRYSLDLCRRLLDEVVLVRESEIYAGIQTLFFEDGLVVEGGAAVGVAALLAGRCRVDSGPVVAVITGAHPDPDVHARILRGEDLRLGATQLPGRPYPRER